MGKVADGAKVMAKGDEGARSSCIQFAQRRLFIVTISWLVAALNVQP